MSDDLVERLRSVVSPTWLLCREAADEIERLRAALQRIADEDNGIPGGIAWAALDRHGVQGD